MVQGLRALTALPDLGSAQHPQLSVIQVPGDPMLSSGLQGYYMHVAYIHTCMKDTHTHKIKIKSFFFKKSSIMGEHMLTFEVSGFKRQTQLRMSNKVILV